VSALGSPGALGAQDVAKVAASAGVDPRTVVRALEGRTKTRAIRAAIAAALREFGFAKQARKLDGGKR
jgi:DNA-binding LacI/PurR family transcriptional regulator